MSEAVGGRYGEIVSEVSLTDTAAAWGEAFPPAASTPFVLGLAEVACHRAIEGELAEGQITVGTKATIEHIAPSRVGAILTARARLVGRGRGLRFAVEVVDEGQVVARIRHQRSIVSREKLMDRLERG